MKTLIALNTLEDIKALERVDSKVSKKYVPIYTTQVIDLLAPEFTLVGGVQLVKGSTKHYVDLTNEDGDHLRIYNSFDRSMALRLNLISDGMLIPLGIDRLIHIGNKAAHFTENLAEAKGEIKEAINTAKKLNVFLSVTTITPEVAKELTKVIFRHGWGDTINEGISEFINYTDLLIDQEISIKQYITQSIRSFLTGEYSYIKNGKKFSGRKKDSLLKRVRVENRVIAYLEQENPEFFL